MKEILKIRRISNAQPKKRNGTTFLQGCTVSFITNIHSGCIHHVFPLCKDLVFRYLKQISCFKFDRLCLQFICNHFSNHLKGFRVIGKLSAFQHCGHTIKNRLYLIKFLLCGKWMDSPHLRKISNQLFQIF